MIFKSELYQEGNKIIATKLFDDIENFIEEQKKRMKIDRLGRYHPLQKVLNRTSGNYVEATAMKSFTNCPGAYLYNLLIPYQSGTSTSLGSNYHEIMEKFYNQKGEERTYESIMRISKESIKEYKNEAIADDVMFYVNAYMDMPDYLNGRPMDHKNLIVSNEVFIKPKINPLGVDLNVPSYNLLDRIDVRGDGDLYVIDYKTGIGDPGRWSMGPDGYLPQMITSSWACEAEYGQKPEKVFICVPGAYSPELKYAEMNVHSLVEQSRVVEKIYHYIEESREARRTKVFVERAMPYCASCALSQLCANRNSLETKDSFKTIPISVEVEDKSYEIYE